MAKSCLRRGQIIHVWSVKSKFPEKGHKYIAFGTGKNKGHLIIPMRGEQFYPKTEFVRIKYVYSNYSIGYDATYEVKSR